VARRNAHGFNRLARARNDRDTRNLAFVAEDYHEATPPSGPGKRPSRSSSPMDFAGAPGAIACTRIRPADAGHSRLSIAITSRLLMFQRNQFAEKG